MNTTQPFTPHTSIWSHPSVINCITPTQQALRYVVVIAEFCCWGLLDSCDAISDTQMLLGGGGGMIIHSDWNFVYNWDLL